MTTLTRYTIGAALTVAVGFAGVCCSASVPTRADRLRLAIEAAQLGCVEYLSGSVPARIPEADALCPLLAGPPATPESDDAPVSGDGGPMNVEQGNATRRADGGE
jgi:hypothetical protein